ncbi:hypothetical protein [Limisalsivibrio acetivorans]|uniref:hypothetical protein n=1 Tax=Limisalsivibrio acetivorans TaxID=1304888 RepID=UPI0003B761C7|nr:hypothetical protein [Limisalsivibrio acetivorans]
MAKDTSTDIFMHLSEEELNKIMLLKSGLEDLNLIVQEIENTYNKLSTEELPESETNYHRYRLKTLEKLLADINGKVNDALDQTVDKSKLS